MSQIFDSVVLDELFEAVGKDDVVQVLEVMKPSFLPRILAMPALLQDGNFDELRIVAHALFGAAHCYGFNAISNIVKNIEQMIVDNEICIKTLNNYIINLNDIMYKSFEEFDLWCKNHEITF